MADWWENYYFGTLNVDPDADLDGDGLTNLQEYQLGLNPNDFYNGKSPTVQIVDGDAQIGGAGGYLSQSLMVAVSLNGQPAPNQTVTFSSVQGGGQVQATASSTPNTTLAVSTNADGVARVFCLLPSTVGAACQIKAVAGGANSQTTVTFNETVGGNGYQVQSTPCSVADVVSRTNSDGSEILTWTNNTDDPVPIYNVESDGSLTIVTTLPAGTTSYFFPAP